MGELKLENISTEEIDSADEKTVQELYQKMGKFLMSKVTYIVKRDYVAQEIIQEVFMRFWNSKISFPTEKHAFNWLYKSCHNSAIDHLRSHAVKLETGEEEGYYENFHNDVNLSKRISDAELLQKLLSSLSAEEAALFGYAVVDKLSKTEISELLEVDRKTIYNRLQKISEKINDARSTLNIDEELTYA